MQYYLLFYFYITIEKAFLKRKKNEFNLKILAVSCFTYNEKSDSSLEESL